MDLLSLDLDWKLAIKRLRKDVRDDFWPDPLGFRDLLGLAPNIMLERLAPTLQNYQPQRGVSYSIPKANFTIRDSVQITAVGRLVYQALIDRLIAAIDPLLLPSVFSNRLRSTTHDWMFRPGVSQWKSFTEACRAALAERPSSYLVLTDITQYFENVHYDALRRQIEHLLPASLHGELRPTTDALFICLPGWSPYDGFGLIQGVDASSFLGNVLLDYVDRMLERDGYRFFRYMDDIRIVVDTEADARRALMQLVCHLREIGLAVNAKKTAILRTDASEFKSFVPDEDPDIGLIENEVGKRDRARVQAIVQPLFAKVRALLARPDSDQRLLRFCLNRIQSLRRYRNLTLPDGHDVTHAVLALMVSRPANTDTFYRYLVVAPLTEAHQAEVCRLLSEEPLCVYPWQNFHLWRLASARNLHNRTLTQRARAVLNTAASGPEAAGADLYLGVRGDYADRRRIAVLARRADRGIAARSFQLATQELQPVERAELYGELDADPESRILTTHIEELDEPTYSVAPPPIAIEDLPDELPETYA